MCASHASRCVRVTVSECVSVYMRICESICERIRECECEGCVHVVTCEHMQKLLLTAKYFQ